MVVGVAGRLVDVLEPGDRIRAGVRDVHAGRAEPDPRQRRREHHRPARLDVVGVGDSAAQNGFANALAASLTAAIAVSGAGLAFAVYGPGRWKTPVGGAIVGGGIGGLTTALMLRARGIGSIRPILDAGGQLTAAFGSGNGQQPGRGHQAQGFRVVLFLDGEQPGADRRVQVAGGGARGAAATPSGTG